MKANRGFTLAEVLVTFLILGLMTGAIFMVLNAGDIAFDVDMGMLEIEQQARQALDALARELRQGQDVVITVVNQDSDRLVFNTASDSGISYYRDLSSSQLVREYPAGTAKVLANNIARFKCALTGNMLEIQIRADKTVRQKPIQFSLAQNLRLRNE